MTPPNWWGQLRSVPRQFGGVEILPPGWCTLDVCFIDTQPVLLFARKARSYRLTTGGMEAVGAGRAREASATYEMAI